MLDYETRIETGKYQLVCIFGRVGKKWREGMTCSPSVQLIEDLNDCWSDDIEVYPSDYLVDKLVNDYKYLFINFSEPGLDREIKCIDGEPITLSMKRSMKWKRKKMIIFRMM